MSEERSDRVQTLVLFLSDCWYFARRWKIKISISAEPEAWFLWSLARKRHAVRRHLEAKNDQNQSEGATK